MIFFSNDTLAKYEKIFFDYNIDKIDGKKLSLNKYYNKVILLVNTASYCGFTKQYDDLQILYDKYKSKGLVVLGVPSNSFNQEKKNEKDIKEFCEVNFNISFPMTSIYEVKGDNSHDIYKWAKKKPRKIGYTKMEFS